MDSFYDAPRRPPAPTPIERFAIAPVVPEVSIISSNKAPFNEHNSYRSWRNNTHHMTQPLVSNRENISNGQQDSLLRKQVRFESPVLHQLHPDQTRNLPIFEDQTKNITRPVPDVKCTDPITPKKTFEEIYMANIPNRHLDLSIIDLKRRVTQDEHKEDKFSTKLCDQKENQLPKTYREFLETQKKVPDVQQKVQSDFVTDIFNYKRDKQCDVPKFESYNQTVKTISDQTSQDTLGKIDIQRYVPEVNYKFKEDDNVQPPHVCCRMSQLPEKQDSEPTNRDLLKIIAQQNEQLLILQKQVAMLLNRDQNQPGQIEAPPSTKNPPEVQGLPMNEVNNTPRKRGMSKFSIDLMTSFEVAIRPQHNRANFNCEPKIQEITEIESVPDNEMSDKMQSLHLQNLLQVPEPCQSPEPSININMNDYDSSDDEISASDIGSTFYHNLMGQVNNILRKAQIQTREDLAARMETTTALNPNKTMLRVKEATLKHLKSIGVTVDSLDDNSVNCVDESKDDYSPTEVSFAVKQLLMKYLPDDQLAKISLKRRPPAQKDKDDNCPGIIPTRPEFSFASLQYMKKYHLIPSAEPNLQPHRRVERKLNDVRAQSNGNQKILDLTALKMQPKLL